MLGVLLAFIAGTLLFMNREAFLPKPSTSADGGDAPLRAAVTNQATQRLLERDDFTSLRRYHEEIRPSTSGNAELFTAPAE